MGPYAFSVYKSQCPWMCCPSGPAGLIEGFTHTTNYFMGIFSLNVRSKKLLIFATLKNMFVKLTLTSKWGL